MTVPLTVPVAAPATALGIGADLCDVGRMQRELEREGHGFRDRVFTPGEVAYCESKRYPAPHYAARFAAKEAVFKALSGPRLERLPWQDAEIENDAEGRPRAEGLGDRGLAGNPRASRPVRRARPE